jgi:ArsR family transcriptional regulator
MNTAGGDLVGIDLDICRAKASIFKAMAHPTRVYLVQRIYAGEMCVTDLMDGLDADVSTISRHLSVLKNAGVVRDERRGSMVFYSLAMPCVVEMLSCVAKELDQKSGIRNQKSGKQN